MLNYKGITYKNTLKDFESWCNEFPPLTVGDDRHHYKDGDYYCSVEHVKAFHIYFPGITFRVYDHNTCDFVWVNVDVAEPVFKEQINALLLEWGLTKL